ncbi:hypothetical protein Tco_0856105 [Tanacetum coccineum]
MLAKCLSSPEYLSVMGEAIGHAIDKGMQDGLAAGIEHGRAGRSITDVVAFNPFAENDYVTAINALKGVIIGETSLAFSLEVAHNRVERLRGDATARRLSLTDSILLLVEPLSSRSLIGEASSSVDFTTVVTTALSTNFAQTHPVPPVLSTEVPPSPKVIFEEE